MIKEKLIRITTVPLSLEKLLEDQLAFMQDHFEVIAVSSEKDRLEAFGKEQGVATHHLEMTREITPLKDLSALYKLYRFLKTEKPKIVHTHTPKAGIVGMMAAYFAGVPVRLHTVAGLPLMEATGFKRTILNIVEKLTYRFATRVYPNSKGLYDFIASEKFAPLEKVAIIGNGSSNGIDTSYFSANLYSEEFIATQKEKIGIPANDFVFIFVGRLVGDKGINELVRAFESIQKVTSSVSLLLVGPFEDSLDSLEVATKQRIEANAKIVTTGYQQDVRPYFAISDALTFPSYREGFPNVVMQAAAMGLPCIVSDINGCNEIITEGVNGLIVPKKNEKALKNAMLRLVNDSGLFNELAANARPSIVSLYERRVLWEALLKEYNDLLK